MNTADQLRSIFQSHLPPAAITYCIGLWQSNPFHFRVLHPRTSKLGDFRYRKDRKVQTITINADLNPFQFLLTYIHEVAHLHAFLRFGTDHSPHGQEWKREFQNLIEPVLNDVVFPKDILIPLKAHMKNPSASSARDLFLMKEMSKYDLKIKDSAEEIFLSDLTPGSHFSLSGRKFKKGETRRTRVLCEELNSGRKFLVSRLAKVTPL
jgi:hypothetical protein